MGSRKTAVFGDVKDFILTASREKIKIPIKMLSEDLYIGINRAEDKFGGWGRAFRYRKLMEMQNGSQYM